jgi:hypothetical protein
MLTNITFCTSRATSGDDLAEMNQCMTFSFSERALKMFSPAFLRRISTDQKHSDNEPDGFEIGVTEDDTPRLAKIRRLDENLWRIPTNQLDAFVRFLFKYLPAEVLLPGQATPEPPGCDCAAR